MKIGAQQAAAFLHNPAACRLVLLYGDDEGLIQERAQMLTRRIAGTLDSVFQVTELTREGWGRIPSEMAALSMIGGRRVVRVREVTDAILGHVVEAIKSRGEALLVLEAPGLGRGRLRTYVEAAASTAALACYPEEGAALIGSLTQMFAEAGTKVESDALAWLGRSVGSDRAVLRSEVNKLVLLAGKGNKITLEMAHQSGPGVAVSAGEDGLMAASVGDVQTADRRVEAGIADGLGGVALVRMALSHLQKMHQARLRMVSGISASEAVQAMRPPIFYRAVSTMVIALTIWPADALLRAIEEARQVELACKRTGSRPDLLASRFVHNLAGTAHHRRHQPSH